MKRIEVWAVALLVGAVVAVDNLLTGRLLHPEGWVVVVSLGLFGGGLFALGAAIVAAWRERARVTAASTDPGTINAKGARGLRWAALAAVMFSVLVFANCSGSLSSSPADATHGAMRDASNFWPLAAAVLLPLLGVQALPGLLATMAQRRAGTAGKWGTAAVLSIAAILVIVPVTMAVAFYAGISACYFSTSEGACAAGAGGLGNVFSLACIALLLPYVQMLNWSPPNQVS